MKLTKNSVITLDNNEDYFVLEVITLNHHDYALLMFMKDGEPVMSEKHQTLIVVKIDVDSNHLKIKLIHQEDLIDRLLHEFSKTLEPELQKAVMGLVENQQQDKEH